MNKSWRMIAAILAAFIASCCICSAESEDLIGEDFTLKIFGNANMDNTIDNKDAAYIDGVIKGTNAPTDLSDANYDGTVDEEDIAQIKRIIDGDETNLTIIDSSDKIITIRKPVEKIVSRPQGCEVIKILKCENKVVGVEDLVNERDVFYPDLSKLPSVGSMSNPDYETIIGLRPDIVLWTCSFVPEMESQLESTNISVVRLDLYRPVKLISEIKLLGYILDAEDEANEFINWYNGYMNLIKQRTDELSDEDKTRVYFEMFRDYMTITDGYGPDIMVSIAGGENLASSLGKPDSSITVDNEWVINQNPDVIVKAVSSIPCGYSEDDFADMTSTRDSILKRDGAGAISAVTAERVYLLPWGELVVTPRSVVGTAYFAKWFHPELFADIDPEAIHQEYLTRFQRLDYDLNEHGVFVYPPLETN
jgi:iron complex transport system substrate-binding protein